MQLSNSKKPIFYKKRAKQKRERNGKIDKISELQQYQRRSIRHKLGYISDDAVFLEKLSLTSLDTDTGEEAGDRFGNIIRGHATDAVTYLVRRTEFWEEAAKMFPSKKRNR